MRVTFRPTKFKVDEENPYWISFSDLMSALLVVFILAVVALLIELTEKQNKIDQNIEQLKNAEKARRDILHEIKDELDKHSITIEIADNDTVLRIPESTLTFESDSDKIPKDKALRRSVVIIGEVLHQAINKRFDAKKNNMMRFQYLDTVFIEGHTDSRPSSRVKGNWGLSTFRAISLWEFWGKRVLAQPAFADMKNAYGVNLFSVSGYAASRRFKPNDITSVLQRANRRIDIRFTVKRPSITQLNKIKEIIE